MNQFIPITEICDFQGGTQPPKSEWIKEPQDGYVRMLQIRDYTQPEKNNIEYVKLKKNTKVCTKEDVLIGRYGASIGKICTGLNGAYNVALIKTIPDLEKLDRKFLIYIFKSKKFQHFILNVGSRAAQAGFNKEDLGNFKIPLPDLSTQKRIAAILDDAAALRDKTKQLLEEYDLLAQSIFLEMFGDPMINTKEWGVKKLGECAEKITDGEHGTVKRTEKGKLYLMARNIDHSGLDLTHVSYISENDHRKIYKRCNAEEGDLLLVCVGATIGKCCLTPKIEEFSLARSVALIKPSESLNSYFLLHQFKNKHFQHQISRRRNTSAQAGLYTGQIKMLDIILPPIDLQNQFAQKMALIEQQKTLAKQELKESEDLFNCLLQKAFKGELV